MKDLTEKARVSLLSLLISAAVILGILAHRAFLAVAFLLAIAVVGDAIDNALERYAHHGTHGHP
ncbi:MAG TPA: hypothetical protein VM717_08440 [Chthoniobacterales bacterium]|jgi:hypothetical protein|nr:hypothetical protein [Chthoniobacterales bacterium]